jgi:hypothetical protein
VIPWQLFKNQNEPALFHSNRVADYFHKDNQIIRRNCETIIAKWVIVTDQPLNSGEATMFKERINSVSAQQPPAVDNKVVLHILKDTYLEVMSDISHNLKGNTYFPTMDHWTSKVKENFFAVIIHYIDEFEFESRTLCCEKYRGSMKAEYIYARFIRDMTKWDIYLDNCCGCVTDTAYNINSFGIMLEKKHNIPHAYYIYHILQLMTKMAFTGTCFHLSPAYSLRYGMFLVNSCCCVLR